MGARRMRGIEAAILSRAVALVTLADHSEGMDEAMCAELESIAAADQALAVTLALAELVLAMCDALGNATDTDPAYIRQRLALIAAEAQ